MMFCKPKRPAALIAQFVGEAQTLEVHADPFGYSILRKRRADAKANRITACDLLADALLYAHDEAHSGSPGGITVTFLRDGVHLPIRRLA